MEIDSAFQTPASRRSPVQMGNNRQQQQEQPKDEKLVTNAFESLKPFVTESISNNMAWLEDSICEKTTETLGVVMPPIGYEANTRVFRHYSDKKLIQDKEDIYEEITPLDQGTNTTPDMINNDITDGNDLNEFGFGYRNGFVYNAQHRHTPESLLYLTHRHNSMSNLLEQYEQSHHDLHFGRNHPNFGSMSNLRRNGNGSNNSDYSPKKRQSQARSNRSAGYGFNYTPMQTPQTQSRSAHKMDTVEDVTTTTGRGRGGGARNRAQSGGDRPRVNKRFGNMGDESDSDDINYEEDRKMGNNNNNNNNNNVNNLTMMGNTPEFSFNNNDISMGMEDTKEENNNNNNNMNNNNGSSTSNPMAWTSKFPIFGTKPSTAERRRQSGESFVSEYSNYTPDGLQRTNVRQQPKPRALTYT